MILAINAFINVLFSNLYDNDMIPLAVSASVAAVWIVGVVGYVMQQTRHCYAYIYIFVDVDVDVDVYVYVYVYVYIYVYVYV